ncbi:MAG: serine acetyltransferase [Dysgonamonadaceae bacterium]|jgi:serine O-acetyltransferase|nr:serine acetyltransferase [Dysgonamonadaceae bacterium]
MADNHSIQAVVAALSESTTKEYAYIPRPEQSLPDIEGIRRLMTEVKAVLFPGFFGDWNTVDHLECLYAVLSAQIRHGLRFFSKKIEQPAEEVTLAFICKLPEIKRLLSTDVKAVFDGDPAATDYGEVIICYPALLAMMHYRVAHELWLLKVPVLPRIMTELAHSATGIDIHPAATIGEYFSIDHGTGVVIGETCLIGNHVSLYQGVTLGAKSFTYDHQGLPMNVPRHPIIEDNVVIYSNSTILGRITIGHDSIIGGNVWQATSVPPYSRIVQHKATTASFIDGSGI